MQGTTNEDLNTQPGHNPDDDHDDHDILGKWHQIAALDCEPKNVQTKCANGENDKLRQVCMQRCFYSADSEVYPDWI